MLKHLLENELHNVNSIEQKFFVPGHSYNSCDRCFGVIEKARKSVENVYLPDDWYSIIRGTTRGKELFWLKEMAQEEFFSCKELLKFIINRKKQHVVIK